MHFLMLIRISHVTCGTFLNVTSGSIKCEIPIQNVNCNKDVSISIWKDFFRSDSKKLGKLTCNSWKAYCKGGPKENGNFVHLRFWFLLL